MFYKLLCNTVVRYPNVMLYCPIVVCSYVILITLYNNLYLDLSPDVVSPICMLYIHIRLYVMCCLVVISPVPTLACVNHVRSNVP